MGDDDACGYVRVKTAKGFIASPGLQKIFAGEGSLKGHESIKNGLRSIPSTLSRKLEVSS